MPECRTRKIFHSTGRIHATKGLKMAQSKASSVDKRIKFNTKNPDTVKVDILQPIDYGSQRNINIVIRQPEFTSLCPMTGLPDYGCITVRYQPGEKIIELKSLKLYLLQYRNVGIFYEHVVNRILDDLVEKLGPKWMEVTGDFSSRGGITTQTRVEFTEGK
jgi:7-cyano-7-deazaguanine reductase